jgi:hypothetical protein
MAPTVTGHRKWILLLTALAASSTAFAQVDDESASRASEAPASGGWASYPRERHLLGRLQGGIALRLFDPYSAGALAPGWIHGQAGYLFLNVGRFRMGPTLGGQLGLDPGHSRPQGALQPGWTAMTRLNPRMALLGRIDLPLVFTRSWDPAQDTCIYLPGNPPRPGQPDTRVPQVQAQCQPSNMIPARVPYGAVPALAVGLEAGATFAYFLTSGLALTAELNGGVFFGDSGVTTPLLGVGLGVLVDHELLP